MVEIRIAKKLMEANEALAARNRDRLQEAGVVCWNVMGSPGAGKTSVLERLATALGGLRVAVVEGDLETTRDAARIEAAGLASVQITTGRACHLDAGMVRDGLTAFDLAATDVVVVENVGNLVCPAGFDLGEDLRVLVASVTEGDDKPAKYPPMFARAELLVLNKVDLLPHVDFDVERFEADARSVRPDLELFRVSCRSGEGVDALARRLEDAVRRKRKA